MKIVRNCKNSHLPRSFRKWGCRLVGRCRARLLLSGTKVNFVWAKDRETSQLPRSFRIWDDHYRKLCLHDFLLWCAVMLIVFAHLCSGNKFYCTLFLQKFGYYSKCRSAISQWSTLLESIPADYRLIHCYQLLHFAVVHGLVITVQFGLSLDKNPVLSAVSLELPTSSKWLERAWNAWKTRFRQSVFQNFLGEGPQTPARGLRAFGTRGRPAPPAAARRTSTQSCRESMLLRPPPNRFHPICLWHDV